MMANSPVLFVVRLPDGQFIQKRPDELQPNDLIVFVDGPQVAYQPQQMDWDFEDQPTPQQAVMDRNFWPMKARTIGGSLVYYETLPETQLRWDD